MEVSTKKEFKQFQLHFLDLWAGDSSNSFGCHSTEFPSEKRATVQCWNSCSRSTWPMLHPPEYHSFNCCLIEKQYEWFILRFPLPKKLLFCWTFFFCFLLSCCVNTAPLGRMAGQGNSLELRKKKSMKFIEILVRCSKKILLYCLGFFEIRSKFVRILVNVIIERATDWWNWWILL